MPPLQAAIFDLDGTLIDTEALCNAAGVLACARLGLDVGLPFFESLAGIHDMERIRLISAHAGRPLDGPAFLQVWDKEVTARIAADGMPMKPGAVALLEELAALGLPLALATSSRRSQADMKLAAAGLTRFFAVTVTFDDVARAKPAPDPYLRAAALLGAAPSACIAFEDSETGAQSAMAAGLHVVQVPDLHPTDGRHAHHVAPDLRTGAVMAGLLP
jgi:HAD superfamily hydrolase (TIGR01509 family)